MDTRCHARALSFSKLVSRSTIRSAQALRCGIISSAGLSTPLFREDCLPCVGHPAVVFSAWSLGCKRTVKAAADFAASLCATHTHAAPAGCAVCSCDANATALGMGTPANVHARLAQVSGKARCRPEPAVARETSCLKIAKHTVHTPWRIR